MMGCSLLGRRTRYGSAVGRARGSGSRRFFDARPGGSTAQATKKTPRKTPGGAPRNGVRAVGT